MDIRKKQIPPRNLQKYCKENFLLEDSSLVNYIHRLIIQKIKKDYFHPGQISSLIDLYNTVYLNKIINSPELIHKIINDKETNVILSLKKLNILETAEKLHNAKKAINNKISGRKLRNFNSFTSIEKVSFYLNSINKILDSKTTSIKNEETKNLLEKLDKIITSNIAFSKNINNKIEVLEDKFKNLKIK